MKIIQNFATFGVMALALAFASNVFTQMPAGGPDLTIEKAKDAQFKANIRNVIERTQKEFDDMKKVTAKAN